MKVIYKGNFSAVFLSAPSSGVQPAAFQRGEGRFGLGAGRERETSSERSGGEEE